MFRLLTLHFILFWGRAEFIAAKFHHGELAYSMTPETQSGIYIEERSLKSMEGILQEGPSAKMEISQKTINKGQSRREMRRSIAFSALP